MYFVFEMMANGSWFLALATAMASLMLMGATARVVLIDDDGVIGTAIGVLICIVVFLAGPVVLLPALAIVAVLVAACGLVYVGYKAADKVIS